jgi:hypothetical protein
VSLEELRFIDPHLAETFCLFAFLDIHLQEAPYQPNLINPADTRHFDDDIPNEVSF